MSAAPPVPAPTPQADGSSANICWQYFFTAFPEEAKSYYENVRKAEEDRENYLQAREDKLIKYVYGLKKQETQQLLLEVLESGPEWQWDRFIREHIE